MKKIKFSLIVSLIALLSFSCGDDGKEDVDTTKPEVTIQTPSENDEYAVGETISLTATFTDNVELKNCTVSISQIQGNGDGSPWKPSSMNITLSGKSQSVNNQTLFGGAIPNCQAGTYKIKIEVSDNADVPNITVKEVIIEIISSTPELTVTKPAEGSKYAANDTEPLLLSAECTDNNGLKELAYSITYMDGGKNVLKGATGINDPWEPGTAKFDISGTTHTFTDEVLYGATIPTSKPGNYKLTLTLKDVDGNSTVKEINIILE